MVLLPPSPSLSEQAAAATTGTQWCGRTPNRVQKKGTRSARWSSSLLRRCPPPASSSRGGPATIRGNPYYLQKKHTAQQRPTGDSSDGGRRPDAAVVPSGRAYYLTFPRHFHAGPAPFLLEAFKSG